VSLSSEFPVVEHEESLGRNARIGSLHELALGTFRAAREAFESGRFEAAAQLIEVSALEAQELREVYEEWPHRVVAWLSDVGVGTEPVQDEVARLNALLSESAMMGIEAGWPAYADAVALASRECRRHGSGAPALIERARAVWQGIHDDAVDRVSGYIDIAVRLAGEDRLRELWDFLLADWYQAHASRYASDNQPWSASRSQLMIAILDGFHAHLAGTDRQGDIEVIEEVDRIGFRFAPCGSGGRSLDPAITDGVPMAGPPFGFAVTQQPHDWSWNKVGVCSYCIHCCLLNEVMPIEELGFPTRVIDAPIWTDGSGDTSCTWWVYNDPSLIPDDVYARVGKSPSRRPQGRRRTNEPDRASAIDATRGTGL
jgi:hypothetical protein